MYPIAASSGVSQQMTKGLVIRGELGKIIIREKAAAGIEIGELLIAETQTTKQLLQVYDLLYASQLSEQNIELISGLHLESEKEEVNFFETELRNYTLACAKGVLSIDKNRVGICKALPQFLAPVRAIEKEDMKFLTAPKLPLFLGKLRSGSKVLPVDILLPGKEVLTHHLLIAATTGKGKSNLTKVLLWDATKQPYCGIIVFDPHDEYYGRNSTEPGLKDHPLKEKVVYYTPKDPPIGTRTLKIHIEVIKPQHFAGVVQWSDAQEQALYAYQKEFGKKWIESIVMNVPLQKMGIFSEATIAVVRRRILNILDLEWNGQQLFCHGVFDINAGIGAIKDIVNELEAAKTVIIDTSQLKGVTEILIGSIVSSEILQRYQQYKREGIAEEKPVISIILEEAPRVLGKEVLERGPNIFSTISREGRKFNVGLCAITQLPSLIPREILANMNTKIILGTEMATERQAIIESAAQDLSQEGRAIASLDKGEAIVTSNFARFAVPVKIPFFLDYVWDDLMEQKAKEESKKEETMIFEGLSE